MAACKLVAVLTLLVGASCELLDREMYDDTRGDMKLIYPSYEDSLEEGATSPPLPRSSLSRKMTLHKMLQVLRNHDASPSFLSVPKWIPTGTVLVPPETFDYSPIKGPLGNMFKRSADQLPVRLRPLRWNIKKGKPGSHLICYFKLCSFRLMI